MSKEKALIEAAKKNDLETIKKLVKEGVNVFYEEEESVDNQSGADQIQNGSNNDNQNLNANNSANSASPQNQKIPNINLNVKPMTAIHYAIRFGHYEVVVYLIEKFPALLKLKNGPINRETGMQDSADLLVAAMLSPNPACFNYIYDKAPALLNEKSSLGATKLMHAINFKNFNFVDFLLNGKPAVDINERGLDGVTALHIAARIGNIRILKELLRSDKIDIHAVCDKTGWNALFFAADGEAPEEPLRLLLSYGCYIDTHSKDDLTLLETLTRSNQENHKRALPIVRAAVNLLKIAANELPSQTFVDALNLLRYGTNARREEDGNTALHLALKRPNIDCDMVASLLDYDADFMLKNDAGESCRQILLDHPNPYFHALSLFYCGVKNTLSLDIVKERLENLKKILVKNPRNESLQKRISELKKKIEEEEDIIKEFFSKAKRETHKNLKSKEKNILSYLFGSFLAGRRKNCIPYYPVEAFEFLLRVEKTFLHHIYANQYLYGLLASGYVSLAEAEAQEDDALTEELDKAMGSEEYRDHPKVYPGTFGMKLNLEHTTLHLKYLIRFAILGQVKDAPLNQYINQYIYGSERGLQGIPDFIDFNDPESCLKLIESNRAEFMKRKAMPEAFSSAEQQAVNQKKKEILAAKRKELQQREEELIRMKEKLTQMSYAYDQIKQEPLQFSVKHPKGREKPDLEDDRGKRQKI